MRVPVSIATDTTMGTTVHASLLFDVWDCSAPMNHQPGAGLCHSMASNVRHKAQPIILEGHDLGPWLDHLPHGYILHELRSSRKIGFSAAKVRANAKPIGCTDAPLIPMIVCGDPASLPYGVNFTNGLHTVFLGMDRRDVLKGWVSAVATTLCEGIFNTVFGAPDALLDATLGLAGFDIGKGLSTSASSLITSLVVSADSGWQEPIGIKTEFGNSYVSASQETSYDPVRGRLTQTKEAKVLGESYRDEVSVQKSDDGLEIARKWKLGSNEGTGWGAPL